MSRRVTGASPLKGRPGGGPKGRGRLAPAVAASWSRRSLVVAPPVRRVARLLAATLGLLSLLVPPALADEQPAILKAYGLDWIERVREEAWPQPKAERPVICLLDTGVAITPDTPADNPEGPIVARLSVEDPLALQPGAGLPQGTTFAHLHGTRMAALMSAQRNGEGTVGVFPQARVVSVRVSGGVDVFITPSAIEQGVRACNNWAFGAGVSIAAIVLAESNYETRASELGAWARAAELARRLGGVFVAAQGNTAGAEVVAPTGVKGVISVSAGSESGAVCQFAKDLVVGDVLGPGCDSSGGWPSGSSSATAAVGALAAAYATRLPGSTATERESAVRAATQIRGDTPILAGELLRDSVFQGLVLSKSADDPKPAGLVVEAEPKVSAEQAARLWRPKVTATWRQGVLTVTRVDRRRTGRLAVSVRIDGRMTASSAPARKRTLRLKAKQMPLRVEAWVEAADGKWRSLATRTRVKKRQ